MKKASILLILITLTAFITIFYTSCGKDDPAPDKEQNDDPNYDDNDDDTNDPEISDSLTIFLNEASSTVSSQLNFDSLKDAALLIVKSNNSWQASTSEDWLDLAANSGSAGTTGVIVGASLNTGIPRNGEIRITSGEKIHKINISQSGASKITLTIQDVSFSMVLVEGDTFTMGSDELIGNGPAHEVTLRSYYICETEVTNELWFAIMESMPYDGLDFFTDRSEYDQPQKPVSAVSWYDVTDFFLPLINEQSDFLFSLPTEAQWEYAALGGKYSEGYDYAGSDKIDKAAWYSFNSDNLKHEIKQKLPNELGLYDMSGNVSEWCLDWYGPYDWQSDAPNPTGPDSGTEKVVRGGDYATAVMDPWCHVKARYYVVPDCYNGCWGGTDNPDEPVCFFCNAIGFRLVLEL
jgi:formylglycine-generating enzyme required for sulfatase activity